MAEERYQAKEKVTQKMTRDGLVTEKGGKPQETENLGLKKRQKVPEKHTFPMSEKPSRNSAMSWESSLRRKRNSWIPISKP